MTKHNDNIVLVGGKPYMSYISSINLLLTKPENKEVTLKSRGKFISKAVDIAEISRKKFHSDKLELGEIKIDSEEFENKEGKKIGVSTIEITLKRK